MAISTNLRPTLDQIELCVFGPGYGECCVVHLGDDAWIVVDSCINSHTKKPVALEYLESIGVGFDKVQYVVATHWHDDHVRGMADQLKAFSHARFCASSALTNKEFLATVVAYEERHNIAGGSGVSELSRVIDILQSRRGTTSPTRACPGRRILTLPGSGALPERVVQTLSPSDKQFDLFLLQVGGLMPQPFKTRIRVPDQSPNDISIAIHIAIGDDQALLLGADLEESGDPELGWSAILASANRPAPQALIFKIPHHGSETGHCARVWQEMLIKDPVSIVTPWNRNKGLPTAADIQRISNLTYAGFCTSSQHQSPAKRSHSVEKQIKETVGRSLRAAQMHTGWVRVRNGGVRNPTIWSVEFSSEACHLNDWRAT